MERITAKEVTSMMEAVANVYGKKGDCVDKSKKTKHNCAKKVCSEQWGEGTCVPEHHTLLEDGTVTHYDVVFEHGLERMVPVEELEVLVTEMHEHAAMEGEELQENQANRDRLRELRQQQSGGNRAQQQLGPKGASYSWADRRRFRRSSSAAAQANTNRVGQNIKVGSPTGPAQNQQLGKPATAAPLTAQQKAYGPNSTLNKDQQAVNREYDRLRKSDPEAAAAYGKKMAAAGAAKKDFSLPKPTQAQSNPTAAQKQASVDAAIKSVNTPEKVNRQAPAGTALRAQQDKQAAASAKSAATPAARPSAQVRGREAMAAAQRNRAAKPAPTPAVKAPATAAAKPAGSIADRLQRIRDMRAASQSSIAAQGGTPATPAVNPTPKSTPPSTTGATTTPTAKPAANVEKKQPLKNGDPMERMTGKGAASLLEAYSKVYEEREPQAIDEGITSVVNSPQDKNKGPGPTSKGSRIKMGPGEGGRFPEKKELPGGPRVIKDGPGPRKPDAGPAKPPYQLPKRTPENAKNVEYYKDDADLFDIIKGHLMSEGLTEEEALQKMLTMTEEERQSIVEQQVPIHPAEAAFNKSTPEERAANTKKYGTPYRPIDTSRRSGDPTAPAWMRGGFKSRDEYNKLDQATKDLLN